MNEQLQFLIYSTPQTDVSVHVVMRDETISLTQKAMAELFGCSADNISLHLKKIFLDNELSELATTEEFSVVHNEFLAFRKFAILTDKGHISKQRAQTKAAEEYEAFNKNQKIVSDFDKAVKALGKNGDKS